MARKKKTQPVDEGDPNAWMATFSDLVTLLITFFVLLLSMSSLDAKVLDDTVGFFNGRLGALGTTTEASLTASDVNAPEAPVLPSLRQQEGDPSARFDFQRRRESVLDEISKRKKARPASVDVKERSKALTSFKDDAAAQQVEELMANGTGASTREKFNKVVEVLKNPKFAGLFKVRVVEDTLRMQIVGDLLFMPGRVRIRPESLVLLREMSELARRMGVRMRVIGVVPGDAVKPARADLYPTGWELAIGRACNVVRYMEQRGGVAAAHLSCGVIPRSIAGDARDSGVIFEMRMSDQ